MTFIFAKSYTFTKNIFAGMRWNLLYSMLLGGIVLCTSCRKDFKFDTSPGNLEFSRDTVYFDTIFTNIGSATYNLKVYNRTNKDIRIPTVRLGQGEDSFYRLNVDGISGKTFENIDIPAKDSIFIFMETTVDIQDIIVDETEFLYTDVIEFDSGDLKQQVALVTLVQDAIFLYPQQFDDGTLETIPFGTDEQGEQVRVEGFFLEDEELTFTSDKPYVIYGYAAIDNTKTLRIEAGTRVYFHNNSGIIVTEGGTLHIDGTLSLDQEILENEVVFQGDRLSASFDDIPGQWGTIWLAKGSVDNMINHLTLKNATVGILVDGNQDMAMPSLTIKNTQIYNVSNIGLWGRTAYIDAENIVIGNAGESSLYCNLGGNYRFKHCTFANYWNNSFRNTPAVSINNYTRLGENEILSADLNEAHFANCIIYGNNTLELLLDADLTANFNYSFANCLLRFEDFNDQFSSNPLYDFDNDMLFDNILFNTSPDFLDTQAQAFIIGENSAANNQADAFTAMQVPLDLLGINREMNPDIGAYQHIIFKEEE